MLRHPTYTRDRIAQVGRRMHALIHADVRDPERLRVAGPVGRIDHAQAELLDYRDASLGERFGPLWATYWFQIEAAVPPEWAGERVDLLWVSHSEATLWAGGRSLQGLNTSPDGARVDALLLERAQGGERLDLRVELACNGLFGRLERPFASLEPVVLDRCQIARFDQAAWDLFHDFDVLRQLEADCGERARRSLGRASCWPSLNRVCNVWREHDRSSWDRGAGDPGRSARPPQRLAHPPALGDRARPPRHGLAVAAGRELPQGGAHVQLAGRLPRSLPGVPVRLLAGPAARLDPPPQPRAVRAHPPSTPRTGAGCRSAAPGSSPTATCPAASRSSVSSCTASASSSASSAVAAASSGTRTCSATTASCPRSCAAPASADSSPRSCRGTVSTRRRTTRSPGRASTARGCWPTSRRPTPTTRPPRSRSSAATRPRATRITTAPAAACWCSAGATAVAAPRRRCWRRCGGSATCRACRAPRSRSSDQFFDALEADAGELPTIVGELYFEYHRGTYTTQAAVKRGNREGERALHDADLLCALAARERGAAHPGERLAELWQLLLLNQFHDILPGSGIAEVYEDAARDHAAVAEGAGRLAERRAGSAGRRTAMRSRRSTRSAPRARRWPSSPATARCGCRPPAYGFGAVAEAGRRGHRARAGRPDRARERPAARRAGSATGCCTRWSSVSSGREALCGARQPAAAVRRPADRLRRLGRRPVPPGDGCRCAAGVRLLASSSAGPLRAEVAIERPAGPASSMRQTCAWTPGRAGSSSTARSTGASRRRC